MTSTIADLTAERDALARALTSLTGADQRLKNCADLCSRLDWSDPEGAMLLVRRVTLGEEFADLPLVWLEAEALMGEPESVAVILWYGAWRKLIRRQLDDLRSALDAVPQ